MDFIFISITTGSYHINKTEQINKTTDEKEADGAQSFNKKLTNFTGG